MTITPEETPAWNPTSLHLFKSPYPLNSGRQWVLEDHNSNRLNFYTQSVALDYVVHRWDPVMTKDGSLVLDSLHPAVYAVTAENGMEVPCSICARKYPDPTEAAA